MRTLSLTQTISIRLSPVLE